MKKIISLMALAAMTACALVSCSDDNDGPKAPETLEPQTFTVNQNGKNVTFKMVPVEAGKFTMGATPEQINPDPFEKPAHSVTLTKSYYMGETEVTQELWEAVMGSSKSDWTKGPKLPADYVPWDECQQFIQELNNLTGKKFRLPTEAEWEFAARGGVKSEDCLYSGSNAINEVAWNWDNSGSKTHAVKTKAPNEIGLYDMSGNVWEWCQDWYGDYPSKSVTNPKGPSTGLARVVRGGGCFSTSGCRVSCRDYYAPEDRDRARGFRLAL